MELGDVGAWVDLASRVDTHPYRLAGRTLGMSEREVDAGPTFWAAVGASFFAGVTVSVLALPALLNRRR